MDPFRLVCACIAVLLSCQIVPAGKDPTVGIPMIGASLLSSACLANPLWFRREKQRPHDIWYAIMGILTATVAFTASLHANTRLVGTIMLLSIGIAGLAPPPYGGERVDTISGGGG